MRVAHCFWGGPFGPLLPVDAPAAAAQLASVFRVDALWAVSDEPEVKAFTESLGHLPWPFFGEGIFREEFGHKQPAVLDIRHPLRELEEARAINQIAADFRPTCAHWEASDPLAPVLTAMVGAYPEDDPGPRYQKIDRLVLKPTSALPEGIERNSIVSILSKYKLRPDLMQFRREPGVFLGKANSPSDLILYWNLRASDIFLLFADERHWGRLRPQVESFLRDVRSEWETPPKPEQRISIWAARDWTTEPPEIELAGDLPKLFCTVSDHTWNGLNVRPGLPEIDTNLTIAAVETEYGKRVAYVPLIRKPFREDQWASRQCFVASVKATPLSLDCEEVTFCPPFVPELNEYYGRNLHFEWNKVRAELDSVGIIVDVDDQHVMLRGLEHHEVISKIFDACGIEANPSHPGRICRRLIRQMGGLQGCRPFKLRGVRNLLQAHPPGKSFKKAAALAKIGEGFRADTGLFIRGSEVTPLVAFDALLGQRVLRVGLDLECTNCELPNWVSLDDLGSDCECGYCGSSFYVAPQLGSRKEWSYQASGLFAHGDNQQGALPVALTLQQLDSNVRDDAAVFSTGMDLRWKDGRRGSAEVDLVFITHLGKGRPAVIVGECKDRGGRIGEQNVRNLRDVADSVEALGLNCYLLFAKAGAFEPEEVERCRQAQLRWEERVILLDEDQLEPYRVIERAEGLPAHLRAVVSVEDLVQLTTHLYFHGQFRRPERGE